MPSLAAWTKLSGSRMRSSGDLVGEGVVCEVGVGVSQVFGFSKDVKVELPERPGW